jgi:hypothetical protein
MQKKSLDSDYEGNGSEENSTEDGQLVEAYKNDVTTAHEVKRKAPFSISACQESTTGQEKATDQGATTDQETASKVDPDFHLEIACFEVKSLLLAESAGADRTEFCANRTSGGVTPPLHEILHILPLL